MANQPTRAGGDPASPANPSSAPDLVVRGQDWYGRDIEGEAFAHHTFVDTDWTEVTTRGASFDACTFSGVRFNASRHSGSAFTNCTFHHCTFFDTRFTDCKLVGSLFQKSTFTLFQVSGGDWSFVGLSGADLGQATFEGVRMREADLTAARLEKATVIRTDLSGATLHQAKLTDADLRGSDLSSLDPLTVDLRGATIDLGQAAVIAMALGLKVG